MSQNVQTALKAEIADLEKELSKNPIWAKLQKAKELLALYTDGDGAASKDSHEIEPDLPKPIVNRRRSRSRSSAIKARILREVDGYFGSSDGPYHIAGIYDALVKGGLEIPGAVPKGNLSAMLSNSKEFQYTPSGWVRTGSPLDPKVAETPDAATSGVSNGGGDPTQLSSSGAFL